MLIVVWWSCCELHGCCYCCCSWWPAGLRVAALRVVWNVLSYRWIWETWRCGCHGKISLHQRRTERSDGVVARAIEPAVMLDTIVEAAACYCVWSHPFQINTERYISRDKATSPATRTRNVGFACIVWDWRREKRLVAVSLNL